MTDSKQGSGKGRKPRLHSSFVTVLRCAAQKGYLKSRLDERATLTEFDWRFNPKLPRQACFELHTLNFLTEGVNALIIGKPGTGKSHVATALAYQGTLQGYDVRYVEAGAAFTHYSLAGQPEQSKLLREMLEPDMLVLDGLFLARRISDASAAQRVNSAGSFAAACNDWPHR